MNDSITPKFFSLLKNEKYSFNNLYKDLFSGIVVGILSIPMSLAFAIASGARPEQGLYTAIIGGLIVAIFGGCRVQVAGPTGAFVLLIFATIEQFGYNGLALATLIAGFLLILMGVSKAGALIKFIPYPVVIGFTSGLALILFVNQLPDFLGLKLIDLPKDFFSRVSTIFINLPSVNINSILLGSLSILIVVVWPKFVKNIPGSLIAFLTCILIVYFTNFNIEIIKDRFGEIPKTLPHLFLPTFSWSLLTQIIPSAIAIALLAGMEALLSSVVADGMTSRRHRSNAELFAQGLANIFSILFKGIPCTGTIARTATCIKTGGQTPFAAIFNVLTIVLVLVSLGKYVSFIPMASLAAVIMVIAYNMSEWRVFSKLFLSPKKDIAVLLTTFFLTVFVDLITAIEVGVILAMVLFISNLVSTSKISSVKEGLNSGFSEEKPESILENLPNEIEVFEVSGPLFFAAAEKFKTTLSRINRVPKILILRLRYVTYIDATAVRSLEDIFIKTKKDKTVLILSGINQDVFHVLEKTNFLTKVGKENVFTNINDAVNYSLQVLDSQKEMQNVIAG